MVCFWHFSDLTGPADHFYLRAKRTPQMRSRTSEFDPADLGGTCLVENGSYKLRRRRCTGFASDLWRQLIAGRLKLLTDDRIKPCSAGLRRFWPPTWWVTAD
jgi:hypothetical protein